MNDSYLNEKKMLNVLSYSDGPKKVTDSYVIVRDQGKQYAFPFADVTRALGVSGHDGMSAEMEVTRKLMDLGRMNTLPSYRSQMESPQRLQKDSPVRYIV